MKLCFPTVKNEGLSSKVFDHFGSAPLFVVVDTDSGDVREVPNSDLHHRHGACSPLKALGGQTLDAVVVGGIGAGALNGLQGAGLKVYKAVAPTIADNVALMNRGELSEWTPGQMCGGHGRGQGHRCRH